MTAVSTTNAGPVNAADASFVTTMTRLGAQNLTMADLVGTRAEHTQLATLAAVIRQHRQDIDTMRDWMTYWRAAGGSGTAVPTGITDAMLTAMTAMHGAMFDDDWLEHMGANYTAAIAACQDELAHGANAQARQLAADWMSWMRGQLTQMRQWHDTWMHDGRFPPMMTGTTAVTNPAGVTMPSMHQTGAPYSDTRHMSDMPHASTAHPSDVPHSVPTSHAGTGHMSDMPHMTSPHY